MTLLLSKCVVCSSLAIFLVILFPDLESGCACRLSKEIFWFANLFISHKDSQKSITFQSATRTDVFIYNYKITKLKLFPSCAQQVALRIPPVGLPWCPGSWPAACCVVLGQRDDITRHQLPAWQVFLCDAKLLFCWFSIAVANEDKDHVRVFLWCLSYRVFPCVGFQVTLTANQSDTVLFLFDQQGNQDSEKLICLRPIASMWCSDPNPSPVPFPLLALELAPRTSWCVSAAGEALTCWEVPAAHGVALCPPGGPLARVRSRKPTTGMHGQPSPPSPCQAPGSWGRDRPSLQPRPRAHLRLLF